MEYQSARQGPDAALSGPAAPSPRPGGLSVMTKPSARDRLARAAFELFDEHNYEHATVDDIAARAGLGRTTFFRYYRSKEDVIFPDHDRILEQVANRLQAPGHGTALAAVTDAARLVLQHYLDEGDIARRRYALTSAVPALHDREIVSVARYQRLFREFLADRTPDQGALPQLDAELAAAAVVAAHNHVLRRWLRGESSQPLAELDLAMNQVRARHDGSPGRGTTIAVFRTEEDIDAILPALRRLTRDAPGT
jgi:AcrR family transcriptional regulator